MLFWCVIFIGIISKVYLSCDLGTCKTPYIKNGNYSTYPPFIRFYCYKNYTIYGQIENRCVCGRWLNALPVCLNQSDMPPECSAPYIQKGWVECLTVGCNRFYVGTEAAIRCERGYQLVGKSRLHCRMGKEPSWGRAMWSSPVPKCVLIDGEFPDVNQDTASLNLFYTENSSIMIIIIILSVLACGLMLLISAMLMNRLVKRRRLMRFQRSDHSFSNTRSSDICADVPTPNEIEEHCDNHHSTDQNSTVANSQIWNCFARSRSRYQHMDTQITENVTTTTEQECSPVETPELYSHLICSDDRESLINPPCYEEAVKCAQYSIVLLPHPDVALHSKSHKKSKHSASKISKREKLKHLPIRTTNTSHTAEFTSTTEPESSSINTGLQSLDTVDGNGSSLSAVGHRTSDVDNVSRRSARVHYSRVVNNISAESNNSFLSGSIETMAVSDGTSVTVHTFDSTGSNPSIGSMRPQTGSIGDPTNFVTTRPIHPSRFVTNTGRSIESDFPDVESTQRYSPPPSYESSINNKKTIKHNSGRSCRSNTTSPSTSSKMILFVDNMATNSNQNDSENIPNSDH